MLRSLVSPAGLTQAGNGDYQADKCNGVIANLVPERSHYQFQISGPVNSP